jgi:hypothetical protein
MKITKTQLKDIIKEEATKLQKKTILENRKKAIIREMRTLNEEVTKEQIEQIIQKHNKDFYKVEDELWNNHKLEIDVYDGHPSESGYFNIINSSGDKVTSGQVEDEVISDINESILENRKRDIIREMRTLNEGGPYIHRGEDGSQTLIIPNDLGDEIDSDDFYNALESQQGDGKMYERDFEVDKEYEVYMDNYEGEQVEVAFKFIENGDKHMGQDAITLDVNSVKVELNENVQMNESIRKIVRESFNFLNEDVEFKGEFPDKKELFDKIKKDLLTIDWIKDGQIDADHYELFGRSDSDDLEQAVEWGEISSDGTKELVQDVLEDKYKGHGIVVDVDNRTEGDNLLITLKADDDNILFFKIDYAL